MRDPIKHGGRRLAGAALLGFLLLYFLFPVAFIRPTLAAYGARASLGQGQIAMVDAENWPYLVVYYQDGSPSGSSQTLGATFDVIFWPVGYLERHVPPYRWLLEKEARWLGVR